MEFRLPLCTPPIAAPLPQKETRSWTQWISSQPTYILYKTYRCIHTHICISLETHNIVYVGFWHLRKQHRTVFCPAIFFTYHCFWAPFKSRLMSLLYHMKLPQSSLPFPCCWAFHCVQFISNDVPVTILERVPWCICASVSLGQTI